MQIDTKFLKIQSVDLVKWIEHINAKLVSFYTSDLFTSIPLSKLIDMENNHLILN